MTEINTNEVSDIVFMFPGYGEQYMGMAKELYEHINLFKKNLDSCATIIKSKTSIDIIDILYYSKENQTRIAHFEKHLVSGASLFAIEYALARTYIQLGVNPTSMIGYSMGEFASACIAETISLENALYLILEQAIHIDTLPPGRMMAVMLSEMDIKNYLINNEIELAAVNGPKVSIISGSPAALEMVKLKIRKEKRIESLILNSPYGFHSYLVEPIMDKVSEIAKKIKINPPKIKYISSVTGDWITNNELNDSYYWARKLREPVLFEQGIQKILNNNSKILIEIGPRQTLSLLVKNHPNKGKNHVVLPSLPHMVSTTETELQCFIKTLRELWQMGININWNELNLDQILYSKKITSEKIF